MMYMAVVYSTLLAYRCSLHGKLCVVHGSVAFHPVATASSSKQVVMLLIWGHNRVLRGVYILVGGLRGWL